MRVVLLGDGSTGKTALAIQFSLHHFIDSYDPTIEDSYRKQITVDGTSLLLEILDTAGQEEYRALRDQWIMEGDTYLLLFALNSRTSFDHLKRYRDHILRLKEKAPLTVIGTKCDLERTVDQNDILQLVDLFQCKYVETSAKCGVNVELAFMESVRAAKRMERVPAVPVSKKKKCILL